MRGHVAVTLNKLYISVQLVKLVYLSGRVRAQ